MSIQGFGVYNGNAANDMFSIADKRLALMSQVTGNESPDQLGAIYSQDKSLALQEANAQTTYDYTTAWQDSVQQHKKKDVQHRRDQLNNGVIFG